MKRKIIYLIISVTVLAIYLLKAISNTRKLFRHLDTGHIIARSISNRRSFIQ